MGLVKTRRLMAMHKQQRAKARLKPAAKGGKGVGVIPPWRGTRHSPCLRGRVARDA
jgi:hypothetical protein